MLTPPIVAIIRLAEAFRLMNWMPALLAHQLLAGPGEYNLHGALL